MKKLFVLVGVLVLALAAGVDARTQGHKHEFVQQTTSDGDSLGAAADTSAVFTVPQAAIGFWLYAQADSATAVTLQVSDDSGTTWKTLETEAIASAGAIAVMTTEWPGSMRGWSVRCIMDGLWTTGKKIGRSYLFWKSD